MYYVLCSSFAVVLVSQCLSNKNGPSDLVLSHRVRGQRAYSGGLFYVLFWWFKAVLTDWLFCVVSLRYTAKSDVWSRVLPRWCHTEASTCKSTIVHCISRSLSIWMYTRGAPLDAQDGAVIAAFPRCRPCISMSRSLDILNWERERLSKIITAWLNPNYLLV